MRLPTTLPQWGRVVLLRVAIATLPLALGGAAIVARAARDASTAQKVDPSALRLLQQSEECTAGLQTYRAHISANFGGFSQHETDVCLEKPNRAALRSQTFSRRTYSGPRLPAQVNRDVVSNGVTLWQPRGVYPKRTWTEVPVQAGSHATAIPLHEAPIGDFFDAKRSYYREAEAARQEGNLIAVRDNGTKTVEGVSCRVVKITKKFAWGGQTVWDVVTAHSTWDEMIARSGVYKGVDETTIYIGPDFLVRRVSFKQVGKKRGLEIAVRNLQTNHVLPSNAFAPPQ